MPEKPPNYRIADSCDVCKFYYIEPGFPSKDRCKKYKGGGQCYQVCDKFEESD